MNKKLKIAVGILAAGLLIGSGVAYFMWNKPQRDVADEKGIQLSAATLVKEYQADEKAANVKYLDKAIEVTGSITEVKTNQEGKTTVMLASEDAFTGVFCTLKEAATGLAPGKYITLKGICSGMLSDVRIRDAIIMNKQ